MMGDVNSSSGRVVRRAPGPSAFNYLGGCLSFLRDPLAYFLEMQAEWGGVVRGRVGPLLFHTLFDPRLVREALVDHHDQLTKRGVVDELIPLLGNGLLVSEGAQWKGRRDGIAPMLARQALGPLVEAMEIEADAVVDRWDAARARGEPVNASADAMHFAIAVIGRALFGLDLGRSAGRISEAVETVARLAYDRSKSLVRLPLGVPTPVNRAYRAAIAELDTIVYGALRDGSSDRSCLLPRLRELTDPLSGASLGDRDLRDEAMSLLLAGHETTANTLAWAFDHLSRDAGLQERIRGELQGGRPPPENGEALGLAPVPVLDAVISETLRLAPPAWIIMRRALNPFELDGYTIPRRSFVGIPIFAIQRNPDHWPEPERFLPDRFLDVNEQDQHAFLPFGLGPRRCPGEFFARAETRVLLSKLLERFRFKGIASDPPRPEPLATLRPAESVLLRLH